MREIATVTVIAKMKQQRQPTLMERVAPRGTRRKTITPHPIAVEAIAMIPVLQLWPVEYPILPWLERMLTTAVAAAVVTTNYLLLEHRVEDIFKRRWRR